jgi:methylmalonyl-CoA mutase
MTADTDTLSLATEFPAATEQQWRKLVDGVLKGAPFEKLIAKTYDGLTLSPLYPRAAKASPVMARALGAPWQIVQRVDDPDAARANAQAIEDLENGATGLMLVFQGAVGDRGFGLASDAATVARVLQDVFIDAGIGIDLDLGPQSQTPTHLAALVKARGLSPGDCAIRFGVDPLSACARSGFSREPWDATAKAIGATARTLAGVGFKGPFAVADGRVVHDAGGSEAQELAYVLASLVAYLRAFESAGFTTDEARRLVYARLSVDSDQFLSMAKLRALRQLWARVEQACGLTPQPLHITAETAWRMLTTRDAAVNMLRATLADFAASVAGADAVVVLPHTLAVGLPDAFARRVARNTQLVLLEESNLAKVADPAAGAGAIEALTAELCKAAWSLFQEIEGAGGMFAALQAGLLQPKIAEVAAQRARAVARRKEPLVGSSEFANLREAVPTVLAPRPASGASPAAVSFAPLLPHRLAEPFEALRERSDAILARTGSRPKVLLATLGSAADFTARVMFARSFFEAGGIEAVEVSLPPPPAGAAAAEAFAASGAALVCLCSSDKVYASEAENAAAALRDAGARHIYLAGRAGELEAALRTAGVSEFIVAGGDALAMLQAAYGHLDERA